VSAILDRGLLAFSNPHVSRRPSRRERTGSALIHYSSAACPNGPNLPHPKMMASLSTPQPSWSLLIDVLTHTPAISFLSPRKKGDRNDQDANVRLLATNSRRTQRWQNASQLYLGFFSTLSRSSIFPPPKPDALLLEVSILVNLQGKEHAVMCVDSESKMCGHAPPQCVPPYPSTAYRKTKTELDSAVHDRMRVKSRSARSAWMMPTPRSVDRTKSAGEDEAAFCYRLLPAHHCLCLPLASTTIPEPPRRNLTSSDDDGITGRGS
jgi:hypothetical protein